MASYNELNALIDAYINRNGVQAITGQILNGVLKAMVEQIGRGYALMGIASPNGDPGTPDAPESYFASEPGTYTNFGGRTVAPGEFALLYYIPSGGWFKETIYDGFQTAQASIDGNVGTPSVGVSYANGVLSFDFHNMKGNPGEPGEDGDAAGFGTIGADITGGVGTPGVSVESSGPATAKNLQFHFTNLKGETGVTSVVVTVDNTTGTPTCTASLSGGVLTLAFTGLKGAQGNPGSSVDYPFTLVNNLTTDDPDQALTAAMGVQLESEISQLEAEVDEKDAENIKVVSQVFTDSQQGKARDNIGFDKALFGGKRNYFKNGRINAGTIRYMDGVGTTDYIPYVAGTEVVWRFGGTGATDIRIDFFDSDKEYLNYISSSGYTDTRTATITTEGTAFIRVSFHLMRNGVKNEIPVSVGGADYILHDSDQGLTAEIADKNDEERRWKPLPLGGLLNSDTDSSGNLTHSTYDPWRVTTISNICVPFPGMRIRHRIPDGLPYVLCGYWWVGTSNGRYDVLDGGSGAFVDGGEITLPSTALIIRPVFRAYTNNPNIFKTEISAEDIQAMIDNGTLAIEYYDESEGGIVERNGATLINQQALRRVFIQGGGELNGMDSMPVFAHITDLHGDAPRWRNFLEYCDRYGVDFALESGDAVLYQKRDSSQFIYSFANKHETDVLACIGNHESYPTGSSTLFADNLADLATKYSYLASPGTSTTKCYYYKDYNAKKVRVIVLNQHEDGVYGRRIGQTQVDWFIATLLSTPVGYGVVICYHAPEDKVVAEPPYDVFRQPVPNTGETYEKNGAFVDKRVIELLVDAFISRTSVDFTYDDHSATYGGEDTTTQTVSVVADFSGVDEATEFICYVCGHRHEDWIGYYDHSENKQLCLCITCGNALYGDSTNPAWSNQSDLPRGGVGVSQDAFCIYAIDRLNGNVKVMRVGATVTQMMVKREMMVIPYKD